MITQKSILLGAKRSQGKLDNGTAYDSTKLYIQTPMKVTPDSVGFATNEYNWGDSTNFSKIKHLKFPAEVELTMEIQTNGKSTSFVVLDVLPLQDKTQIKV